MSDYQRQEAIDFLCIITEVDPDHIEEYDDIGLEAWLGELGYVWNPNSGIFGAWVPYDPPPIFAPTAVHVECSDFGPLFEAADQP